MRAAGSEASAMIKLSLCVPTYNRVTYLRELMPVLIAEVETANRSEIQVELLISNNASTDSSGAYLSGLSCPGLRMFCNGSNIGGDRNFLACVDRAAGEYVWLFGDDEVILPGAIVRVLALLSEVKPALLVLRDARCGNKEKSSVAVYSDYVNCVRTEGMEIFALAHTLITANVFRRDVFDLQTARAMLRTSYAHMYGLLLGLRRGGRVAVAPGVFRTRPQRAQFEHWPTALCVKQGIYLWRLAAWFGVPQIRCFALRLIANLPVEVAGCWLHKIWPSYGRT